jgi:hypothetical protein
MFHRRIGQVVTEMCVGRGDISIVGAELRHRQPKTDTRSGDHAPFGWLIMDDRGHDHLGNGIRKINERKVKWVCQSCIAMLATIFLPIVNKCIVKNGVMFECKYSIARAITTTGNSRQRGIELLCEGRRILQLW